MQRERPDAVQRTQIDPRAAKDDLFFQRERNRTLVLDAERGFHTRQDPFSVDLNRLFRAMTNGDVVVEYDADDLIDCV